MAKEKIKVLVVDDTAVSRRLLTYVLNTDPSIEVIGTAGNGKEALAFIQQRRPDVITMDLVMPEMDGYETTRRIMEQAPIPIVVVTAGYSGAENGDGVEKSFKVMAAGAVAILATPDNAAHAQELVRMVKAMAEVKLVRRQTQPPKDLPVVEPKTAGVSHRVLSAGVSVVVIGASTGGPPVLEQIFASLPADYPLPVLLVQHMAKGFLPGFVDWLNQTAGPKVLLATHGMPLQAGTVLVAPDGVHMGVTHEGRIALVSDPNSEPGTFCPSVAHLFRSAVNSYGRRALGILLTGMGRDGAAELKLLRDVGASTVAQSQESCIVFGMPGEAVRLGAAATVAPPAEIVEIMRASASMSEYSNSNLKRNDTL